MAAEPAAFSAGQRASIGVCVAQLSTLTQTLRGYGVVSEQLDQLEQALESLARATRAQKPRPPRNRLNAALAQMLVLEEELRPRRLTAYGTMHPDAARILDEHVQRLVDLTSALIAELQSVDTGL